MQLASFHALNLTIIKAISLSRNFFLTAIFSCSAMKPKTKDLNAISRASQKGSQKMPHYAFNYLLLSRCAGDHAMINPTRCSYYPLNETVSMLWVYSLITKQQTLPKFTAFVTQTSSQSLSFKFQRFFFHNHKAPDASSCYPFHAKIL